MSSLSEAQAFQSLYGGTLYTTPGGLTGVRTEKGTVVPSLLPRSEWNQLVEQWKRSGYQPNRILQVASPFLAIPYAIGAGLNSATGGTTTTYNVFDAVNRGVDNIKKDSRGAPVKQTVSNSVSTFSFLNPQDLSFQLPFLNDYTGAAIGDAAKGAGGLANALIPTWAKWAVAGALVIGAALIAKDLAK